MGRPTISDTEIIQMTLENVRCFYSHSQDSAVMPMADNFMWIGFNDIHWCENLEEFHRITEEAYGGPPALLSDEEFHVLFHDRNVWVLYGRYKITTVLEDKAVTHAHARGTYVWRKIDGELKLIHVHTSHAQDVPLNQLAPQPGPLTLDSNYFEYVQKMDPVRNNTEKLSFRDREKHYHYLLPSEIVYLQASGQWTIVHTESGSFQTFGLLAEYEKITPEIFRRIHKSYIVNSMYIDTICRYTATLRDGREFPIGKERYMELKRYLQKGAAGKKRSQNSQ